MAITKEQVDAKLKELGLTDTPENRKTARQDLKKVDTDTSWEPIFKQKYPQYSWMFTDLDRTKYADVFDFFGRAQKTNMSNDEFAQQWVGTSFYKELLQNKKSRELKDVVGAFDWAPGQLAKFLTKATQYGYEGDNLKQQAYTELFSKVDNKYVNPKAVAQIMESSPYLALKRIGTQYLNVIDDETIKDALAGGKTSEDLLRVARETAKASYPHLKEALDAGVTLEELSKNFKATAAKTLELDPAQISMSDPKFNAALNYTKDGAPRMLSLSEWETELRTNSKYGYSFTKQANQDATSIGLAIARAFGKVG